jgi:hypothetical protein
MCSGGEAFAAMVQTNNWRNAIKFPRVRRMTHISEFSVGIGFAAIRW